MSQKKNLNQLIEEFLEFLEVGENCSPLTIRNYRHYLSQFSGWLQRNFPQMGIQSLDIEKIRRWRLYLARFKGKNGQNLSLITQSYHVIALRSFLKRLHKLDYKTIAPEKIDLPKTKSRSLKFLNIDQIDRLLAQSAISTIRGLRDKAIMEITFTTGLRVSEVVSHNRGQLDLKQCEFGVVGEGRSGASGFFISPGGQMAPALPAKKT